MGDYWKQVHSRAVAASRQDLGLGSWKQIMIKAVIGVAIILALAFWGSGDASGDEIVVRVSLIAVAIFLFPLVYLINFATIPPKLAAEADKKLSAVSAEQSLGMSRLLLKFVEQALLVEQATQPLPSVQARG